MKAINNKLVITVIWTVTLFFSSFQIVKASLGSWTCYSMANIQGSSFGYACKMVRKLSSVQWGGDIVSYTDYPQVSMTLGWTYFTTRETCNGTLKQQVVKGGLSVYATQRANTTFMSTMSCAGTRYGYVLGKHEFKNSSNVIVWSPEWTHGENLP